MKTLNLRVLSVMVACLTALNCLGAVGDKYGIVNSLDQLSSGDEVIICHTHSKSALAKTFEKNTTGNTTPVSFDGQYAVEDSKLAVFVFSKVKSGCSFQFKTATTIRDYICSRGQKNIVLTSTKSEEYAQVSFNGNDAVIKYKGGVMRSTEAGNTFSFAAESSYNAPYCVQIYKKMAASSIESLTLNPQTSWTETISGKDVKGKSVATVSLQRSFIADGGWYTLCLPFALTADEISEKLHGAKFQEFAGVTVNGETGGVELSFRQVTSTEAGKPYLVKPVQNIAAEDLVFENKVIGAVEPIAVTHATADGRDFSFVGIFSPTAIVGQQYRFLGGASGTELRVPGSGTMQGYRAYFVMPVDLTAEQNALTKVCVGNDEATAINSVADGKAVLHKVYSVAGRYLGRQTDGLKPGIYIVDGKKTVVK